MSLRCRRAVDVRCLENRSCSGPRKHVVSATPLTANQAGNDGNTAIEPYDAWGIAAQKRVPISLPNAEVSHFRDPASTRSMKESISQTAESFCRWLPCMWLDETPTLEHWGTGCGGSSLATLSSGVRHTFARPAINAAGTLQSTCISGLADGQTA